MSTIVKGSPVIKGGPAAAEYGSYIGYDNIADRSDLTITASSEATGYGKELLADWRPHTWWKATATGESWVRFTLSKNHLVDYFAVSSHNLSSSGSTIKLQYSLTGGASWVDVTDAVPGLSDQVIFIAFDEVLATEWRVVVNNPTAIASVGVVSIGKRLDLGRGQPVGYSPAALSRRAEYMTNESNTGLLLGRSVERTGYPGSISIELADPNWVRTEWEKFLDHAQIKPFFLSWKHELPYTNEAVFAWTDGEIAPAAYSNATYMRAQLKFNSNR